MILIEGFGDLAWQARRQKDVNFGTAAGHYRDLVDTPDSPAKSRDGAPTQRCLEDISASRRCGHAGAGW